MPTHASGNCLHIDITEADILNGQRGDCGYCPAALALKRWIPATATVDVDDDFITIENEGEDPEFFIPGDRLAAFIRAFDTEEPVEPGLYEAINEDDGSRELDRLDDTER